MRVKNGTSGLYKRRCFGYTTDGEGDLQINNEEATVVHSMFDMYIGGESLVESCIGVGNRRCKNSHRERPVEQEHAGQATLK